MATNIAHAELNPQPVVSYESYCPEIALTVDEEEVAVLNPAVAIESGNDIEVTIFNDQFVVEKKFTIKDFASKCNISGSDKISLSDMWVESADMQSVVVSRNFFVKNNKWCVLLGPSNNVEGDKYIVMDEDGNLLGELPTLPRGEDPDIFLSGFYQGTPYMLLRTGSEESFQLYKFTGQAGIQAVKVATVAKAYPNPLPAGQTFNVELAQPADNATFISVVDMKGRQILRRRIAPNETVCHIPGSRVSNGQYIYTVVYGNGETVSGKLLAE